MAEQRNISGIGASDGIRIGVAYRLTGAETSPNSGEEQRDLGGSKDAAMPRSTEAELARLERARERSAEQLTALSERAKAELGEQQAAILAGQRGFLQDPAFFPAIVRQVQEAKATAEAAVGDVVERFASKFEALDNPYMRERAADIRDVGKRLLAALDGGASSLSGLAGLERESILIADDLSPSETIELDKRLVLAFVTRAGGKTSHTAILARSLGIPAVVGAGEPLDAVRDGEMLIVDGAAGLCIASPDADTLRAYEAKRSEEHARLAAERQWRDRPAVSADGRRVEIGANIGTSAEAETAADSGADGIGLYRTEMLFMQASALPDEEQQVKAYREAVRRMGGRPVIVRTMDIGGDKELPYMKLPKEMNPFLGYRAIRIGLEREDLLRAQLRAIIRAGAEGPVKVMFPMVSGLGEWRRAKLLLDEEYEMLRGKGLAPAKRIEAGIMVEIPSAALLAESFAREVDFFSIGTNDLVQYTLAVDRMNEKVAPLYDYFHPAVLQLIKRVIEASHAHGKWTGMCGGMAGDPLAAPLLLGYGLDEWSMDVGSIPKVKKALAGLDSGQCRQLAERLTALDTPEAVRAELARWEETRREPV